jgi:uncharacterized protein (TIGR02001 family)
MTFKFKVAAVAMAISAVGAAHAQKAPEPDYTLAFNVGAVSQYRFRGIEQSSGQPELQAGVDFAHKNGFYAGAWTSGVNWVRDFNGANSGEREIDYFLGFKVPVSDITFDIGAIKYTYPGNDSGAPSTLGGGLFTNADTTEVYLGINYGITSFKLSHATSDFLGNRNSSGSRYYEFAVNLDLGNGLTLVPHMGRQIVQGVALSAGDYTDFSLTLNKDFGNGWSASVAAIGTNAQQGGFYSTIPTANPGRVDRFLGSNTGVVGVKYTF